MYLKKFLRLGVFCLGISSSCFFTQKLVSAQEFEINEENIPDKELRDNISKLDMNNDGKISDEENKEVTEYRVSVDENIKGLELLNHIETLYVFYRGKSLVFPNLPGVKSLCVEMCNEGTSLEFEKNDDVEVLTCKGAFDGKIKKLDISGLANVNYFTMFSTDVEEMDFSKNLKMEKISITGSKIVELSIPKDMPLKELDCSCNEITKLTIPKEVPIVKLDCSCNMMKEADFSELDKLEVLNICDNSADYNKFKVNKKTIKELSVSLLNNKKYLLKNYKNLEKLDLSCKKVKSISVTNCKKLVELNIMAKRLTSSDIKKCNSLKEVIFSKCKLKNLSISGKKVKTVICDYNNLKKLNLKTPKLEKLYLRSCKLSTLNVSKYKKLKVLDVAYNKLSKLDVTNNKNLKECSCQFNKLSALDVSKCKKLKHLYAYANKFGKVDITNNKKIKKTKDYVGSDIDLYQGDEISVKHTKVVKENGKRYLTFSDLKTYKRLKKMTEIDDD